MTVVSLQDVSRRYGRRRVVDGVDLDIGAGQIVGLLGPNGAGKTTILRMIAGLTTATSGVLTVFGNRVGAGVVPRDVGLVLEESGMIPSMSAGRNLTLLSHAGAEKAHIDEAIAAVGLPSDNRRPIRTWSQGMRRRLVIAQALMGRPRLLLLDEPTNGLDPVGVARVRELLLRLRAQGVTVLVSSHALTEIERLCDRVVFVQRGRLVHDVDLRASPANLVVTVGREVDMALVRERYPQAVPDEREELVMVIPAVEPTPDMVRMLVTDGVQIEGLVRRGDDLERMFLDLVDGR